MVRLKLGTPIFFLQIRAGREREPFAVQKFRTMTHERSPTGKLLSDEDRLLAFGKFLRSTSLDELPQLWNIARGDMAFVGPRPLPVTYVARYSDIQRRRLEFLPGLTGLAQIQGRNSISWEERFSFDISYVDSQSIGLDVAILAKTLVAVVSRRGVSEVRSATMSEFLGTMKQGEQ